MQTRPDLLSAFEALLRRPDVPSVEEALSLQVQLQADPELASSLPHPVWHWLADADIRRKDPEYRKRQDSQVEQALAIWRTQNAI
jgi:hypothetical protein